MQKLTRSMWGTGRSLWMLVALLGVTAAVRVVLMPLSEPFPADLSTYWEPWFTFGAQHGLVALYREGKPVVNYPPLYLTLLTALGKLYGLLPAPAQTPHWQRVLIKLPALVADMAIVGMLFAMSRRLRTDGPREQPADPPAASASQSARAASRFPNPLAVAVLWALNPAVIYIGAFWGQVDSLHTMWMLAALLAALATRWGWSGALLALGLLTKVQAIVLLPLLLYLGWRQGRTALTRSLAGLITTMGLGLSPFILTGSLDSVLRVYVGSVGFYNRLTLNAYNLWWPVQFLGQELWDLDLRDDMRVLGPLTLRWIGLGLLAGYVLLVFWALHRALKRGQQEQVTRRAVPAGSIRPTAVFFAAGLLVFGFFMLPTEIHERYILPALAFLAPVAWLNRRLLLAYLLLCATVLLNQVEVLPFAYRFYQLLRAVPGERLVIALVNVALLGWLTAIGASHFGSSQDHVSFAEGHSSTESK